MRRSRISFSQFSSKTWKGTTPAAFIARDSFAFVGYPSRTHPLSLLRGLCVKNLRMSVISDMVRSFSLSTSSPLLSAALRVAFAFDSRCAKALPHSWLAIEESIDTLLISSKPRALRSSSATRSLPVLGPPKMQTLWGTRMPVGVGLVDFVSEDRASVFDSLTSGLLLAIRLCPLLSFPILAAELFPLLSFPTLAAALSSAPPIFSVEPVSVFPVPSGSP
mmetsp:Transcript_24499/g.34245  ORF Transcript_24499/g.34245 Transcript_24499/m.34245 type:complete len:220 (-) Transcript_24499:27-686(-)